MLVQFTAQVPVARAAAWAFVADFKNIGAWDPGVKSAVQVREEEETERHRNATAFSRAVCALTSVRNSCRRALLAWGAPTSW